jgi:hypothetical protein
MKQQFKVKIPISGHEKSTDLKACGLLSLFNYRAVLLNLYTNPTIKDKIVIINSAVVIVVTPAFIFNA